MAEPDATQTTADLDPSPPGDTGQEPDGGPGPNGTGAPASTPPLWEELGYSNADELKATHTRYKQQVGNSTREFQRYQQELAARDARIAEFERRTTGPPAATGPATNGHDVITFDRAVAAYLDNDNETLARYQQQQDVRVQESVLGLLQQATRPAQYSEILTGEFKELADPNSELYKRVYDAYDLEAAHPKWKVIFAQDEPMAQRDAYAPDGSGTKKVDMRIVLFLANKIHGQMEREAGSTAENRRRAAAGGAAATGPSTQRTRQETPTMLIYEDDIVNNPTVIAAEQAAGRNRDSRKRHKAFWDALPAAEKARRMDLWHSGSWTGKRRGT